MAARATWKGVLKIALVTVPIKVYPATEEGKKLSFNQLHDQNAEGKPCHARIKQQTVCPTCDRVVLPDEIVKGYEFEPGQYVILLPEELEAVHPESTRVIDLVQFADAGALDPVALDRSYYLAPDGDRAAEAFAVILTAMTGSLGIGKLAIYGREYLVAVRPTVALDGLQLHTLHHAAEIRVREIAPLPVAAIDQVRLARHVIAALHGPLDLSDFTDQVQVDLKRLIAAKIAGEEIVVPPVAPVSVLSLKDALTQSLIAVSAGKKRTAKATVRKKAS